MKIIKNGKVYDTATARKLGEYAPNPNQSDFSYYCETLYQKKTGEYFLHGAGNASSPYSKSCGINEMCSGEEIKPLSYEAAQKWAEDHLDGDEYCEIFGDPDEDAEDEKMTVRLSASAASKLAREAAKHGITKQAQLERWILDA
jgi:hypothetical protein